MNEVATLNNNIDVKLPKLQSKKKKVLNEIRAKAEQAKLNLIYTELKEAGIPFEEKYSTVKELQNDLKNKVSTVDFNKIEIIINKINTQIDETVENLSKGSTNAFTNLMTSDLTKTIGKTLGISLAGRTALILAPTVGTKAIVGTAMTGLGLYRVIKNRNEIKTVNENNELNSIISDIETTKDGNLTIDTRLSADLQNIVRVYLKNNNINFQDTGYRSLRQAMYSLDINTKRGLVDLLNNKSGKGINVQERIEKSKRKLNVVAVGATTTGLGLKMGVDAATAVNSVNPGLLAGGINATFLANWVEKVTDKKWYSAMAGGLGYIGTNILENLPVVGGIAEDAFALENIVSLGAIGATGGLITGAALGLTSSVKQILNYRKTKKENDEFLKLDAEKYKDDDINEFKEIKHNLENVPTEIEALVLDVICGSLNDEGIHLENYPKNMNSLKSEIEKLNSKDNQKAKSIIAKVERVLENPSFESQLLKAGKISIGMFTAGLAALSVYDIIKGGTFLPELSKSLFPNNNIHIPLEIPEDGSHVLNESDNPEAYNKSESINKEFQSGKGTITSGENNAINVEYFHENSGENFIADLESKDIANSERKDGESIIKYFLRRYLELNQTNREVLFGFEKEGIDYITDKIGVDIKHKIVPNLGAISEKLDSLSPEELLFFTRYMRGQEATDELTKEIKRLLFSPKYSNIISNYIQGFETINKNRDLANNLIKIISTGAIPTSVFVEALANIEKQNTNSEYGIKEEEIHIVK